MKGMIYTTFAILAASLIFFMAALPMTSTVDIDTSEAIRIGEASFYLDSVLEDVERSTGIAVRRGLTGASNYIIGTGEPLDDAEDDLTEAIVNGSINGVELNATENASLGEWGDRVENMTEEAGYRLEMRVSDYSFDSSGFHVETSKQLEARLEDPVTLASFNRSVSVDVDAEVKGVEDPMLLLRSAGRYTTSINYCGFDEPANYLDTGSSHNSPSVLGEAVVEPGSSLEEVEDRNDKILVVEDVDGEDESEVEEFRGVVSYQSADPVDTGYVYGIDDLGIGTGQDLILYGNEVWESNFRQMIFQDCYVPADAPGLMERYENDLTEVNDGMLTFVDVGSLPDALRHEETAVGYKYFPGDGGEELNNIAGVTDRYSWFRLDNEDAERLGVQELVK